MPSYQDTERSAREEANKVIEWFLCDHELRAESCEREALDRLLSVEQVRTATIHARTQTIEYFRLDGTSDGNPHSFLVGSTVGDIGLLLGWFCAKVITMYGEVLDPTSNADENETVMVMENSGMIDVEEAQKLASCIEMVMGIVDLRTKCQRLAELETRITVSVRERIAEGESRLSIGFFKRNILFPIRMAFLHCCAALHVRGGGDDADLDQFSGLIREFTPNDKDFQARFPNSPSEDRETEWISQMRNALIKAWIFPRMVSNRRSLEMTKRGKKRRSLGSA